MNRDGEKRSDKKEKTAKTIHKVKKIKRLDVKRRRLIGNRKECYSGKLILPRSP